MSTIEDPYRTFASAFKVLVAVITAPQCKFHAAALSYDGDAFRRQYLYVIDFNSSVPPSHLDVCSKFATL